ncbi:MAG: CBS domain-containing protein [Nakamurella sp.]
MDGTGGLVGIVTEADLISNRYPAESTLAGDEEAVSLRPVDTVGQCMTTPVIAVSHDADVAIVARSMLAGHRRCLPVIDGDALVGIISRSDIVHALARSDDDITADVRRNRRSLCGLNRWTVDVSDGEASIGDRFHDASERAVALTLAVAVPSVTRAVVTNHSVEVARP